MSKNKDSQAPQYLGLSEDLATVLAEWSEAFNENDLPTVTRIYEQGFQQYSRAALEEWRRQYISSHPGFNKFKKIVNTPNPFPPQKNCKDYLNAPAADVLYPILHVREGANKVGSAPYRKAIWDSFFYTSNYLAGSDIPSDIPNCVLFDLVDEFVYQAWQHSNHHIRQRNKYLVDLSAATTEGKENATATDAAAAAPSSTEATAAATAAQQHNIRQPEFDSIPGVWGFTELYKKFSDLVAKTKIEDRLKDVAAGKLNAIDIFVSKPNATAKQIATRVNSAFGFMCLFGLIRLNVAAGDYFGALEVSRKLIWEKTGPAVAETVSRAHTAIVHNVGASLMMTRRFSDAVSVFLQGLEYPATAYRRYHEQAQVQVWGLTQICSVLANVSIPDYTDRFAGVTARAAIAKGQQASAEDITVPMTNGDITTFKETFVQSMPKYIAVGFNLRTPVTEIKNLVELNPHDVLEVQLKMFLREVQQNLTAIQMRGAMRVYSAFPVAKVNELAAGGRETAATAAQNQLAAQNAAAASASGSTQQQSPTSANASSPFPNASTLYDVPASPSTIDAVSTLVNLKTKSVQYCEHKSESLNPNLKVDSLITPNSAGNLRCVSTVDFSSDLNQVQVHRYKEVTTIGVRLNQKILSVSSVAMKNGGKN